MWKNPIFKALLANKTQCDYYKVGFCALASFPRIANPDSCYWYRSPFNLVLYSDISATSGETKYLNDFMLTRPTRSISDDFSIASLGWSPDLNDKTPSIIIKFPRQVTLKKIVLYQNCSSTLESIRVVLDNGFEEVFQCTNNNVLKLALPSVLTNQLELRIVSYGDSITLNEIECYEEDYLFPWDKLPFKRYEDKGAKRNEVTTSLVKYFYKVFLRFLLIKSKVKSQLRYK